MNDAAGLYRLLGDTVRLRILRLLLRERLNVSELTGILGMAQSGISRHLRLLKEGGLLQEDRHAGWSYYRVDTDSFSDVAGRVWPLLREQLQSLDGHGDDDARLAEILRQRKEEFREPGQLIVPGRSWAAWSRAQSFLVPDYVVADLGCGEGLLTLEVARWAKRVIAVDRSMEALRKGKALARKRRVKNIQWKQENILELSMLDRSVDVVLISQVLHSVADPDTLLRQAYRVLKSGGHLLLQELRSHREEWVKEKFGDIRLGFEDTEVTRLLEKSGFVKIHLEVGAQRHGDPFVVLIGCGRKKK